jgi:hypothetical protein
VPFRVNRDFEKLPLYAHALPNAETFGAKVFKYMANQTQCRTTKLSQIFELQNDRSMARTTEKYELKTQEITRAETIPKMA